MVVRKRLVQFTAEEKFSKPQQTRVTFRTRAGLAAQSFLSPAAPENALHREDRASHGVAVVVTTANVVCGVSLIASSPSSATGSSLCELGKFVVVSKPSAPAVSSLPPAAAAVVVGLALVGSSSKKSSNSPTVASGVVSGEVGSAGVPSPLAAATVVSAAPLPLSEVVTAACAVVVGSSTPLPAVVTSSLGVVMAGASVVLSGASVVLSTSGVVAASVVSPMVVSSAVASATVTAVQFASYVNPMRPQHLCPTLSILLRSGIAQIASAPCLA